jgi:hypothetical protein
LHKIIRDKAQNDYGQKIAHAPTEKDDDGVALRRDETKHEHIFAAAVVTLWGRFTQGALGMQNDLLVFRAHEVVDDV